MRPIFVPYKMGSSSAKALQESLRNYRAKRVRPNGNYRPFRNHIIINWGCTQPIEFMAQATRQPAMVLNPSTKVNIASNKLECFRALSIDNGVNIPEFTTDRAEALNWLEEQDATVISRTLTGSHGRGISVCSPGQALARKNLYVKYIKKRQEYRVHVFLGEMIDVQRKMKAARAGDNVDWKIRNYDNGFIFGRSEVEPPQHVINNAVGACHSLGLHFGAVDVIHNEHYDKSYVLEVNTAPGLQGTTLERYAYEIRRIL